MKSIFGAALLGAFTLCAGFANAATLDFDSGSLSGNTYTQDGFVVEEVNGGNVTTPNNCNDGTSNSNCLLLQNTSSNKIYKLSRADSGLFNLLSFTFNGTDNKTDNALRVSTTLAEAIAETGQLFTENNNGNLMTSSGLLAGYQDVSMIFFRSANEGSARVDDIAVSITMTPVPLPASAGLLLVGLGGIAIARRRK